MATPPVTTVDDDEEQDDILDAEEVRIILEAIYSFTSIAFLLCVLHSFTTYTLLIILTLMLVFLEYTGTCSN